MGKQYALLLGPLAFSTIIFRSILHGWTAATTIGVACLSLFVFAAAGYAAGRIAEHVVVDSVHRRFRIEVETTKTAAANSQSNENQRA